MIRLEDVSALNIVSESNGIIPIEEINKAILSCNIKDYGQLEQLIETNHPIFDKPNFRAMLEMIKENIEYANILGIVPEVFYTDNYKDVQIDKKTLKATERKTFCRQLVINHPILGPSDKVEQIKNLKISEAKILLSKIVAYNKKVVGNNAFLDSYSTFTEKDIEELIRAINFYETQIINQYLETGKRGTCLFGIDKQEREKIVENEIKDIIYYFVDNADECIWGLLTDEQKRKLVYAIKNKNIPENNRMVRRMINVIANYTTLSEIENGIKIKTLDKFIIR